MYQRTRHAALGSSQAAARAYLPFDGGCGRMVELYVELLMLVPTLVRNFYRTTFRSNLQTAPEVSGPRALVAHVADHQSMRSHNLCEPTVTLQRNDDWAKENKNGVFQHPCFEIRGILQPRHCECNGSTWYTCARVLGRACGCACVCTCACVARVRRRLQKA